MTVPETPQPAEWLAAALQAVRRDRVVEIARALVDTHSPTGAERACATRLQGIMAEHGVEAELDPFADRRANLVATVAGGRPGLRVMLVGHLDTTGFGDDRDRGWLRELSPSDRPISRLEDGIVSGLGAYNMKGGVAAATEALLAISTVRDRMAGSLTLAALAGESEKAPVQGLLRDFEGPDYAGGGIGAERLLETGPRPDAVVVCEPSGLAIVNAQPGYLSLRILILGRAGYLPASTEPTVITALAAVTAAIQAWAPGYAARHALDCGLGTMRPTCTIGAVESGAAFKPGGTPNAAAIYLDLRIPPGTDSTSVLAELEGVARGAATASGRFEVESSVYARNLPGAVVPADHPLILASQAARSAVLGRPAERAPDFDFTPGDDGKVFARSGIPYVKVGPGSPQDRDPRFGREQVRADALEAASRLYVELAARLTLLDGRAPSNWPRVTTE